MYLFHKLKLILKSEIILSIFFQFNNLHYKLSQIFDPDKDALQFFMRFIQSLPTAVVLVLAFFFFYFHTTFLTSQFRTIKMLRFNNITHYRLMEGYLSSQCRHIRKYFILEKKL